MNLTVATNVLVSLLAPGMVPFLLNCQMFTAISFAPIINLITLKTSD